MMLNVCGITYAHSPNYGSCMQAYALQTAVESRQIGGEPCSYQLIPIQLFHDYPAGGSKGILIKPLLAFHRRAFRSFYQQYMHYVDCRRMSELKGLNDRFDAFVTGSDVVWNHTFNRNVGAYYLDFAEKYKFSYAASFGKAEISEQQAQFIGDKIDRLDRISVREPSGVTLARRFTSKPVEVVADPVLLLSRDQWSAVAAPAEDSARRYIFVYATHLNDSLQRFIDRLKEQTGLEVVYAVAGPKQAIKMRMPRIHTPQQWLRLLCDAEYVITNSFHATVFSTIFHKKFFTVVHGVKSKGINVRMYDYLNRFDLSDRMFSSAPDRIDLSDINYDDVDKKIEAIREESLAFLKENLEAAYQQKKAAGKTER